MYISATADTFPNGIRWVNMCTKLVRLFLLFLLSATPTWAQAQPAATAARPLDIAHASILVLGVSVKHDSAQQGIDFDARARSVVQAHVTSLYRTAKILNPSLRRDDLGCRSRECWALLSQTHQADYLLTADILDHPANYSVEVALADRQGHVVRVGKKDCTQCSEDSKPKTLASAVDALFTAQVVEPLPSILPSEPAPIRRACPQVYSFGRGLAIGASSSLLFSSLFAAVSLSSLDGKAFRPSDPNSPTYALGPHQGVLYGLSGLSAAALGLSLGVARPAGQAVIRCPTTGPCPAAEQARAEKASASDSERAQLEERLCREPAVGKRTFFRGLALGSLGGMLVSSLVATATFGGLQGQPYDAAGRFTYRMTGPLAVSGSLAALSAVGFLAAFPW